MRQSITDDDSTRGPGREGEPRARGFWRYVLPVTGALWLLVVGIGLTFLWTYAYEPGPAAHVPARWPAESIVPLRPERPTLVFVAHPKCPCTRASLRELDRLVAQCEGKAFVHVLFFRPRDASPGWEQTDLWQHASTIPGVEVHADPDGAEARRFGARISGQTMLFTPSGELLFEGGITAGRGHEGDNDGRSTLVALLRGATSELDHSPVYGCPIAAPSRPTQGHEALQ